MLVFKLMNGGKQIIDKDASVNAIKTVMLLWRKSYKSGSPSFVRKRKRFNSH